ncbi:hypothetical protein [Phenylobacterium sp.]|uniref:hypothetical protein n=1 Tax=Phenylobacterium sp. TaxID=1871053 RepID=UPI002C03F57A|nr:hypothetical protein [Phenylobacterium sp.]HLZ77127.1 hypothetical protein [Phenylobacterium sp.]
MRRADFLALTNLDALSLNTMAHRKVLPFDPKRSGDRGWAYYTGQDALRTELMLALAARGHTQVGASGLVRVEFELLRDAAAEIGPRTDLYFGFAERGGWSVDRVDEEDAIVTATSNLPVAGPLADIGRQAQVDAGVKSTVVGVVLVNVSHHLRLLRARAELRPGAKALLAELDQVWAS